MGVGPTISGVGRVSVVDGDTCPSYFDHMVLKVTVWSDYLCPWCYLGQARADRLELAHGATLTWMPYELHPGLPEGGRSIRAVYGRGDGAVAERALDRFRALADEVAMPFTPPERVLPTRLAHLAALAVCRESPDSFADYHRQLFDAIWLHDRDIERADVLADIAEEVGADAKAVRDAGTDAGLIAQMDSSRTAARNEGITGTPGFLFNGSFAVVGLQPFEFFDRVATRLEP